MHCHNHDLRIEIKPARRRHWRGDEERERIGLESMVLSSGWASVRQVLNFIARRRPRKTG